MKKEGNDGRICAKFCISLSHNLCFFHRLSVSLCFYLLKRRIEAKKYFLSFVMLILFKSTFSWKKLLCDKLITKVQGFWKGGSVGENAESGRKQVFRVRFAEKKEWMNENENEKGKERVRKSKKLQNLKRFLFCLIWIPKSSRDLLPPLLGNKGTTKPNVLSLSSFPFLLEQNEKKITLSHLLGRDLLSLLLHL